jgi:hypothetical protein
MFVATAHIHQTDEVLDKMYIPTVIINIKVVKEMQTIMFSALEYHFKTDKGISVDIQYESTLDAQSIYGDLKKREMCSKGAHQLVKSCDTAQMPGHWSGTAYDFFLHWKEKALKYKTLEIEELPPKQKLQLLQHAVRNVSELSYVKQVGDSDISRNKPPLKFEGYIRRFHL